MNVNFFIPAKTLIKAENSNVSDNKKRGIIGKIRGIASTPDLDKEGERVLQEGLDISEFTQKGFLNWDHDNSKIIGYPDSRKTKMTKDGLFVEGYILDTDDGRRAWDTAIALEKSGTDRRLGFSIEGQVLKQDNKGRILKARVTNVALTSMPVNPYTSWNTVAKSLVANNAQMGDNPFIKESLENAKIYCQKGLDGDIEVLESIQNLQGKYNDSKDKDDVKFYLMFFKGMYGDELSRNMEAIMKELKEE